MPYEIVKEGENNWVVKNKETGKAHGRHKTKQGAEMQMKALYANEPEAKKK